MAEDPRYLNAEYLGAAVAIASNDPEHLEFLQAAGRGEFVLQQCAGCERLRYPVGNACPLCQTLEWRWAQVSGRGTVYSYEVVVHPIHPSFREVVPYVIVLVELDEQRGFPSEEDGLRVLGMLVDAEGRPESEDHAGINARVEVDFADLGDGLALPRFRLSDEPAEHPVWRFGDAGS
jgi:uncharacterized OB-fold protein